MQIFYSPPEIVNLTADQRLRFYIADDSQLSFDVASDRTSTVSRPTRFSSY